MSLRLVVEAHSPAGLHQQGLWKRAVTGDGLASVSPRSRRCMSFACPLPVGDHLSSGLVSLICVLLLIGHKGIVKGGVGVHVF